MSTIGPKTQKLFDMIQERADAMTGNYSQPSYPWPDPTDERIKKLEKENAELRKRLTVDEAMVERAAQAMMEASPDSASITDDERDWYIRDARVALDAALNIKEEA